MVENNIGMQIGMQMGLPLSEPVNVGLPATVDNVRKVRSLLSCVDLLGPLGW